MRHLLAIGFVGLVSMEAIAGPFGLVGRRGGSGSNSGAPVPAQADGELWSAQGVANRIARTGIFRHWGNPSGGYEGIGMGGSPEAARQNCCYANRLAARDVGYAQMASGMWVAVQRY